MKNFRKALVNTFLGMQGKLEKTIVFGALV